MNTQPASPTPAPTAPVTIASELESLALRDLKTFLMVREMGSFLAVAESRGVTPSQVSKAITRLEVALRAHLFDRRGRGVVITAEGERIAQSMERALREIGMVGPSVTQESDPVTVVGPDQLVNPLLARFTERLAPLSVRALSGPELSVPPALMARADVQVTLDLPPRGAKSWSAEVVGELELATYTSPERARELEANGGVTLQKLSRVPFITRADQTEGHGDAVADGFPLALAERTLGIQVSSLESGLQVAAARGHLIHTSALSAHEHVEKGLLVPVFRSARRAPVYLVCHATRVTAKTRSVLRGVLHDAFVAVGGAGSVEPVASLA